MKSACKAIPTGAENIIPHIVCAGADKAIEFYKQAFGAVEVHRIPAKDGKRIMHACLSIGGSMIYLNDDFPEFCGGKSFNPHALQGTAVTLHRYVEDCDAAIKKAVDAGATIMMPPADTFWGDRYGIVIDPFGHRWSIATHLKDMTPEEIQTAMKQFFG